MIYHLGDVVTTRKPHPCGGREWEVVRTGADYKIKCKKCGRTVMLTPDELRRAVKSVAEANDNDRA